MKKGAWICNEGMALKIQKGDLMLTFENCAETLNGCILELRMTLVV